MTDRPTLADIHAAEARLRPLLPPSPLEVARAGTSRPQDAPTLGAERYLKLESALPTHSFKIRGALNAMLLQENTARERGVVSASSGNHAQALAHAAARIGAAVRLYMAAYTTQRKQQAVRRLGAEAIAQAADFDEAERLARADSETRGALYISAYNDFGVICGAGTAGLEMLAQLPELARVVVPTSGGGLLGGIALALKSERPDIEVIGVNALACPAMYNELKGTDLPHVEGTLADALVGSIEDGSYTLPLARRYVDDILLVTEEEIAAAIRWLCFEQGWLAEGGAVVGLAACLSGKIPDDGVPTAIVISGGNIDSEQLREILCA